MEKEKGISGFITFYEGEYDPDRLYEVKDGEYHPMVSVKGAYFILHSGSTKGVFPYSEEGRKYWREINKVRFVEMEELAE